jgi:ribonuclease P protein component
MLILKPSAFRRVITNNWQRYYNKFSTTNQAFSHRQTVKEFMDKALSCSGINNTYGYDYIIYLNKLIELTRVHLVHIMDVFHKGRSYVGYAKETQKFEAQADTWFPEKDGNSLRKARSSKAKAKRENPIGRMTARKRARLNRTITSSREIREILKNGREVRTPGYRLVFRESMGRAGRFAILTSKRMGSAVQRNRIRRRIREMVRSDRTLVSRGIDMVIVPKAIVIKEDYNNMLQEFHNLIKEILQ